MINITIGDFLEKIPSYVIDIAETLQKHDFEAFLVGGSVRDILLGRHPSDFDIATNAYPEVIVKLFKKSIPTGAKFGTITVVTQDENGERFDVEVTTYRSEADYVGGRWPSKVEFSKNIYDDLARRDFTINAIALNLQHFDEQDISIQEVLEDPFNGISDLNNRTIKAVRDPLERFSEDGLRGVRACRFASQLNFEIEQNTFEAITKTNHITAQVSIERFRDEFIKIIYKSPVPSKGIKLLDEAGILKIFIPELLEGKEVVQPKFHAEDVWNHSLKACDLAEDSIKLAALFHDIAKPRTKSEDEKGVHFYGHDTLGSQMTKEILTRLKFPKAEIDYVSRLVRWHMFYYPSADWRKLKMDDFDYQNATKDEIQTHIKSVSSKEAPGGWTDSAIRRLIKNVGGVEALNDLFKLRIADASANAKSEFNPQEIEVLAERVSEVTALDMALKVTDLDVSGQDLINHLGLSPGQQIGQILNSLLDKVIEDPILNKKETLLHLAQQMINIKS